MGEGKVCCQCTLARIFSICYNVVLALQSAYFSTLARSMQVHLGRSLFVTRAVEEPEDHKERLRDIATRKSSCISRRVSTHFGLTEKRQFKGWGGLRICNL